MSNPAVRHAHPVEQVLDALDIPPRFHERIHRLLTERDVSIEDGINAGLRKEISAQDYGDGATITTVLGAGWAFVTNLVAVYYEKQHTASRLEITGVMAGEMTAGALLAMGVTIVGDDDPAFVTAFQQIGQWPMNTGFAGVTGIGNTALLTLPQGRYYVALVAAVGVGDSWVCSTDGINSIRVVESLY